jgi:CBS domain-containing protein
LTSKSHPRGKGAKGTQRAGGRHRGPWTSLTARDVMRAPLVTIRLEARLSEVEEALAENRITGLPVVDAQDRIVGVVSVRDLIELYAQEPASRPLRHPGFFEATTEALTDADLETFEVPADSEATAADAMTAHVFSVKSTASLGEVARHMTKHHIHRILVEEDGRHVGIIGAFDLLAAIACDAA